MGYRVKRRVLASEKLAAARIDRHVDKAKAATNKMCYNTASRKYQGTRENEGIHSGLSSG